MYVIDWLTSFNFKGMLSGWKSYFKKDSCWNYNWNLFYFPLGGLFTFYLSPSLDNGTTVTGSYCLSHSLSLLQGTGNSTNLHLWDSLHIFPTGMWSFPSSFFSQKQQGSWLLRQQIYWGLAFPWLCTASNPSLGSMTVWLWQIYTSLGFPQVLLPNCLQCNRWTHVN